jgi:hypothetical protein
MTWAGGDIFACAVSFCKTAENDGIAGGAFFPGLRKSHRKKSTAHMMMRTMRTALFFLSI